MKAIAMMTAAITKATLYPLLHSVASTLSSVHIGKRTKALKVFER